MKKVLFIAAAVTAMAACTKSEVVYDGNDAEIGLSPVNYSTTKSNYYGAIDGNNYPVDENFGVFAQYTESASGTFLAGDDSQLSPYLTKAQFSRNGNNDGIWTGTPNSYYWPRTGSLYFAGYSPYDITGEISYDFATGHAQNMSIDGFTQNDYYWSDGTNTSDNEMIDLLWFDALTSLNGGTYAATFKHALSYITLRFNADVDDIFTVTGVGMENVYNTGNFDSNNGYPSWKVTGTPEVLGLYNWGQVLKESDTEFLTIDDVLLIPQETAYINIDYKQRGSIDSPDVQMPTYRFKLTGGDSAGNDAEHWLPGQHYIYTITFGIDEIKIKPTVTKWQDIKGDYTVNQY